MNIVTLDIIRGLYLLQSPTQWLKLHIAKYRFSVHAKYQLRTHI